MLSNERFVTAPTVSLLAKNVMTATMFENAVADMGMVDVLETDGTPINKTYNKLLTGDDGFGDLLVEYAGRFCYRSFDKGRDTDAYIENILEMGHGSVTQHASITIQILGVSRSLTHELVRHGTGTAYSQESQRYVDAKDVRFVVPPLLLDLNDSDVDYVFQRQCSDALEAYGQLQFELAAAFEAHGATSVKGETALRKRIMEAARSLLPNAAETRMVMTLNMRALRYIALLRGAEGADLEIRRLACHIIDAAREYAPEMTRDIEQTDGNFGIPMLKGNWPKV